LFRQNENCCTVIGVLAAGASAGNASGRAGGRKAANHQARPPVSRAIDRENNPFQNKALS
jgi:hypothetical protein